MLYLVPLCYCRQIAVCVVRHHSHNAQGCHYAPEIVGRYTLLPVFKKSTI